MRIERRHWAWWPLPVGAVALAAAAAVAVPALAGGVHGEQAKKPTLASLAKQIFALRSRDATLRRTVTALSKKVPATGAKGSTGATGATGAAGAQGAQGPRGPEGEATAYARVAANGTLEPGDGGKQNKNVIAVDIEHDATTGAGVYCFGGLPFAVASAMVSPDSAGNIITTTIASVAVQRGIMLGNCDPNHQQARVSMVVPGAAPTLTDHRFQVWFEATGGSQIAPAPGGD